MGISIRGLATAFRTLSIISWPGKESDDLSSSLPWFPIAGLVLGLILYAIARALMALPFTLWASGTALIILAAEVWLTRGLHLDGLADWADSLGGILQREKRLAIMKDTNVGVFGVLALILALAAKWLAFERLLASGSIVWLLAALILSRGMMVELITTLPYARTGEGMGRAFVKGASQGHRFVSLALCLLFCLPFGPFGLVLFVLAGIVTRLFRARCQKGFGGITGDLLGTANEMIEICLLMVCALPGKGILSYTGWNWVF
ncbi:MAG: adenosylcobinamide-GDP ribazoletransferase [Deltaproteobacteria bacterium]|nr:adenosylcobinamide-GDP ribazoletransferase [Deltaproteobacteria bacterium]